MSVVAIVVARGGSQRLPNKALLPFGDSTLIGHKVKQLLQCKSIDRVVVGSDSMAILDEADNAGADIILRDAYHCDESRCSANDMLADMASKVSERLIVWAHPTNPLVKPSTYDNAIGIYREGVYRGFDSLCSVTRIQRHCWTNGHPDNFDPWQERHPLAKELQAYHFQDGAIFIQPRQQMVENRYFYGRNPILFEIDPMESVDVDVAKDLELARAIHYMNEGPPPITWEPQDGYYALKITRNELHKNTLP